MTGRCVAPERLYMRSPGIQRPSRVLKLGVGCPSRPQSISSSQSVLVSQYERFTSSDVSLTLSHHFGQCRRPKIPELVTGNLYKTEDMLRAKHIALRTRLPSTTRISLRSIMVSLSVDAYWALLIRAAVFFQPQRGRDRFGRPHSSWILPGRIEVPDRSSVGCRRGQGCSRARPGQA